MLISDVKASRPDWSRGKIMALTSWPLPRAFGLDLVNSASK